MNLVLPLFLAISAPTTGGAPTADTVTQEKSIDAIATGFFDALKAGQSEKAIDRLMNTSPMWKNKTDLREAMLAQVDAANRVYGPVAGWEPADSETIGTMAVRNRYLVQHRDNVTRWELIFVRTPTGWIVAHFNFNDQILNWF